MRILLVAMSDSVHTIRWISQIDNSSWDMRLFPSIDSGVIHPELGNVKVYHSFYGRQQANDRSIEFSGFPVFNRDISLLGRGFLKRILPNYRILQLKAIITRVQPAIVHSMEIQAAGYLTLEVKKRYQGKFPPWIVTNWGSDISLFGRLAEHEPKIREVLDECDYYSCECERDVKLARDYGFRGKIFPVFPNSGGFDLKYISNLRQPGPVSNRRKIMLKGYQNWAGRALVGLRALERCADLLSEYEVVIYSANADVKIAAELFHKSTGISTTIIPEFTSHHDILQGHGQARISIGLSIGDAISTSLLEAIAMGPFPIQSWTSCADEWIVDGKTGILVPPEDTEIVEQAIRRALTDDELVDRAAEDNYKLSVEKLDKSMIKPKVADLYRTVINDRDRGYEN